MTEKTLETQRSPTGTGVDGYDWTRYDALIEQAFREGYKAGYNHGEEDQLRYEHGGGSKHPKIKKYYKDQAWDDFKSEIPRYKGGD